MLSSWEWHKVEVIKKTRNFLLNVIIQDIFLFSEQIHFNDYPEYYNSYLLFQTIQQMRASMV